MVLGRAAFGVRGNKLPSVISWLLTVGWETVLIILATLATATVGASAGGVIVRTGPDGCLLAHDGAEPVRVSGFPVVATDTNGAGDTHTGSFAAALARGADVTEAARLANAAAALSVTKPGPATAPTATELARSWPATADLSGPRAAGTGR